jgi:hypothetical protein
MLISTILYFLGVPLWMLIGMLILIFWNSNRVKKQPGSFPLKVSHETDPDSDEELKWPRRVSYAQWVHDVLILRKGPGLMLTIPYGIKGVEGSPQDADPEEVKGLGDHPIVIRVLLDDDSILMVAVRKLRPELAPEHFQKGQGQEHN